MIYSENILICIAVPFLIALLFTGADNRRFIGSFLTGMAACLIAAYISGFINYAAGMDTNDTAVFLSPVIEEIIKVFPLLFYLILLEPSDRHIIQLALGLGTGFATFENCCYILSSGAARFSYILIRGLAVGVMHFVGIFALALCLVIVRRLKVVSFAGVMGALTISMTFHGLYNLLVSGPQPAALMGYALPVLTVVVLYIPYRRMHPGGRIDPDGA